MLFPVLHAHGHASCRDGLHSRGAALVGNPGEPLAIERGVAVVRASSAEGVVTFREQLQHQLFGFHAEAEQQAVVPVIGAQVVLVSEHPSRCPLDGLVAAGTGVDVFRRQPRMRFEEVAHGTCGAHGAEGFKQCFDARF